MKPSSRGTLWLLGIACTFAAWMALWHFRPPCQPLAAPIETKEPPMAAPDDPEDVPTERERRKFRRMFGEHLEAADRATAEELLSLDGKKQFAAMAIGFVVVGIIKKVLVYLITALFWAILAAVLWHFLPYILGAWVVTVLLPSWLIAKLVKWRGA